MATNVPLNLGITSLSALRSPWVVKEPPDQAEGLRDEDPWLTTRPGSPYGPAGTTEGPSPSQLPANRSWDPGALADAQPDLRTPWDYLIVAGSRTPGIADVRAHKGQRLDRKSTPGADGETVTHLGLRCGEIIVRILLLTQADLEVWAKVVPLLQPTPGKARPDPVAVDHPALVMNGITSLYVEDLGVPQRTEPGGPLEVTVRFVEFLPSKKAGTKTPQRSKVGPLPDNQKPSPKPSATLPDPY